MLEEYMELCSTHNYPPVETSVFAVNPEGHMAVLEDFISQTQ